VQRAQPFITARAKPQCAFTGQERRVSLTCAPTSTFGTPIRKQAARRFTPFQLAIGAGVACLVVQIGIVAALLRTRSSVQPLLSRSDRLIELADQGPYISVATVNGLFALAATELAKLAEERIQYTVHISQTVPISTQIAISERIAVPVSLIISHTIPVHTELPFQEKLLVPVRLEINQVLPISTSFPLKDELAVPVDQIIHIDERFEITILGQEVQVPIRGDIPVKLDITVPIDKQFPIRADIPVALPISTTLAVDVRWTVPVELEIPVNLPIETEVVVDFHRTIPLRTKVPVVLDVPLDIAIGDTPFGAYLQNLSEWLRAFATDD
jgi:hypothetical protein